METRHPYKKLHWYPHLIQKEAAIWDRFIERFPDMYDWVEFDVKVGSIPSFVTNDPDASQQGQAPLYQAKIDVVAYKDDQIDIIELKERANIATLAQVLNYRRLYVRDFSPPVTPKAIIVTTFANDALGLDAVSEGAFVVVV